MKTVSSLLRRLKSAIGKPRSKKGSSLAFVMAIGAALVIWVMCIMPLMATTGTVAAENQVNLNNYIGSRSAIEFCKSQLQYVVRTETPYTFAVIGDEVNGFQEIPKRNFGTLDVSSDYSTRVNSNHPSNDSQEVPKSNDVVAICAVVPNALNPAISDVVITTYIDCEKDLSYVVNFTPSGSLKIFPEAYNHNSALPLSDFVLVDGKLGPNMVWQSNISMSSAQGLGFTERLLPFKLDRSADYASSGEYPAVFKTTAQPARASTNAEDAVLGDPVTEEFTDEIWFEATALPADKTEGDTRGQVWYTVENGKVRVWMYTSAKTEITNESKVYFNGAESADKSVPAKGGVYQISVDYTGKAYAENDVNILPFSGMQMAKLHTVTVADQKYSLSAEEKQTKVEDVAIIEEKDDQGNNILDAQGNKVYSLTATLTAPAEGVTDLLYACVDGADNSKVRWSRSHIFEDLTVGKTYFFYVCRPASIDENGVFLRASNAEPVGRIFQPEFVSALTNGENYLIMGGNGSPYYPLANDLTAPAYSLNDGYVTEVDAVLNNFVWTAGGSGTSWNFKNVANNKYLNVTSSATTSVVKGDSKKWHDVGLFSHNCYPYTCVLNSWNINVNLNTTNYDFTIGNNGSDFTISYPLYHKSNEHRTWDCSSVLYKKTTEFNGTGYLNLNGGALGSTNSSTVKFAKVPSWPTRAPEPNIGYSLGTDKTMPALQNPKTFVAGKLPHNLVTLYTNGSVAPGSINAGVYNLVVTTNLGKADQPDYRTVKLPDMLTVNKNYFETTPSVIVLKDETDDMTVNVSASGLHGADGGSVYFGYRLQSESEFHWFHADAAEFSFRLPYTWDESNGYVFAVKETGSINYHGCESAPSEPVLIQPTPIGEGEIDPSIGGQFKFEYKNGEVIWYRDEKGNFPKVNGKELNPSRLQLVFGTYAPGTKDLTWSYNYPGDNLEEGIFYGILILNSPYDRIPNVLEITEPIKITNIGGYTSSYIRGSSIYLMGRSSSLNTEGNTHYIEADLLVLFSDITHGSSAAPGSVMVNRYSNNPDYKFTLLYSVNEIQRGGVTYFKAKTFYKIPMNTDLCNLNAARVAEWEIKKENEKTTVNYWTQAGHFPDMNPDIAYTTKEQISRIVSGETIGWTNDGVLSGNSTDSSNAAYAVCAYVTKVNGGSFTANRALIAAKETSGSSSSYTLTVPSNLTFTTRYLSVDADQIKQGSSNVKFMLRNLGENTEFLKWLKDLSDRFGFTSYISKTLQMDYERFTTIYSSSNAILSSNKAQVYRYDDNTDLFAGVHAEALMAVYTPKDIEALSKNLLGSTVKNVDRYVTFKDDDNGDGSIDFSAATGVIWKPYTNYLHFDESIDSINFWELALIGKSDILINSQESGYTTQEYLGLFQTHSAESYAGTLLYFENDIEVTLSKYIIFIGNITERKSIAHGFYYIPASTDGTSLFDAANSLVKLTEAQVREMSVYIDPITGELSNAYVDTGLFDSDLSGAGGFSGGTVG